jgi:hypothetical protein
MMNTKRTTRYIASAVLGVLYMLVGINPAAGSTIMVGAGDDLQAAINNALPGDTLLLEAGATFVGNYVLPASSGTDYITIRSAADDSTLPDGSTRIDPTFADMLPKIQSPNSAAALATAPGAHHYLLQCLEFLANYQGLGDVVELGDGSSAQNTLDDTVPHDLILDRVYIHGDPTFGQKRGISLNSAATTIVNSYIANIWANDQDSQAIAGWNGSGPFTITNNYLEASGENFLLGGADPSIPNLVPSNITFTRNYLSKPFAWEQTNVIVKNLLELKNAQNVIIDSNILENNWVAEQSGYAVVFTPRNQDGTAPWTVVQQVSFTNNIVRHVASGVNILGTDTDQTSQLTNDILIRNNLFYDVSSNYGGDGRFLLISGGTSVTIDHNTVIQDGVTAVYAYGPPVTGLTFTNNILPDYGLAIIGDSADPGNDTIWTYFPGATMLGNIIAGSDPSVYPDGNMYPATLDAVGFVDLYGGNYALSASSPYLSSATDGTAVGCDPTQLYGP